MIEIAKAIQEGAMAYLRRQFRTIVLILLPVAAVVFLTSTAVFGPEGEEVLTFRSIGDIPDAGIHRRVLSSPA